MDREAIARIIDPIAFKAWQSAYDYCIAQGDPEDAAVAQADWSQKRAKEEALAKADDILALASPTGVQAFYDAVREFGPEGQLIAVRIHHDDSGWDVYDPASPNAPRIIERPTPTGDAVKAVARAILKEIDRLEREYGFDRPMHQLQCLMLPLSDLIAFRAAIAVMPPVLPEGWVAVPRGDVPLKMINAAIDAAGAVPDHYSLQTKYSKAISAAIAAAPSPDEQGVG
jgi:hypothetical protein